MTSQNMTYEEALAAIWQRSDYDRGFVSNPFAGDKKAKAGIIRTAELLGELGRPQDRLKLLHVAGSKGKGSTTAFAANILTASGVRTGRYTSPHLHSFRERIAVDGVDISEAQFAQLTARALDAAESIESKHAQRSKITAFELTTAMALDHFAASGCQAAVIEVGMGGLLDATNVIMPVGSLITALDFEHTAVLGDTIDKIAFNKAGIIKPYRPVAVADAHPDALQVMFEAAEACGSLFLREDFNWESSGASRSFQTIGPWGRFDELKTGLIGLHQMQNATLAIAGCWFMLGAFLTVEAVRAGLESTRWPGRFEIVPRLDNWPVILDGAHTPASAEVLVETFLNEFPDDQAIVVLGVLNDKNPLLMASALLYAAKEFVAIDGPGPRGMPAAELAARISGVERPVRVAQSLHDVLEERHGSPVIVTGSLSTVALAREALGLATSDQRQSS